MIGLIRKFDPALYLDLHVTDGTDYQYDITYAFSGWNGRNAASPRIGGWLDKSFRPAVNAALKGGGHIPGYYVSAVDNNDPDKGMSHDADTARYSTGYGDLRRLPTVLVETHSLKPYRQRVLGTYVLVEAALRVAGDETPTLRSAIDSDRAARPTQAVLSWKTLEKPIETINFLGVSYERYHSVASGRNEIRWLGKPVRQRMPVFGQVPDKTVTLPAAWWVPISSPSVIERLKLHGIACEVTPEARSIALDMARLVDPKLGTANEGHVTLTTQIKFERRTETFPAGSVRVPSDQPLGLLAAALLEPESPESMLAWGYFPEILQRTEYIEGYAIAPLAEQMLASDPALKAEFEAKLKSDPKFAKNPEARLGWFYERTRYYDERYLLYPVARERRN